MSGRPVVYVWEMGPEMHGLSSILTRRQEHAISTALWKIVHEPPGVFHPTLSNVQSPAAFLAKVEPEGMSFGLEPRNTPREAYVVFWKKKVKYGTTTEGQSVWLTEEELKELSESALHRFLNFIAIPLGAPATFREVKEALEELGAEVRFRSDPRDWEPADA